MCLVRGAVGAVSTYQRGDAAEVRTCPFDLYAAGIPFPEGPVVNDQGQLFVCARRDGYIAKISRQGSIERFAQTGGKPNGLAIDAQGQLLVADAIGRKILVINPQRQVRSLIGSTHRGHALVGPNDLCFGPSDDLYFTDPGLSFDTTDGSIFRVDVHTKSMTSLASGLRFPNGLTVSGDGGTLYFVDSPTASLWAIDLTRRTRVSPRLIRSFGEQATPDGMAWLDQHRLLIALHGSGELARVDTHNNDERRWSTGLNSHPTNVVLHGNDCFVTDDALGAVLHCEVRQLKY